MRVLHARIAADRARIVRQAREAGASPKDVEAMLRWHAEQSANVVDSVRASADEFFGDEPVRADEAEIVIGPAR
jgi:hypothetical protein